MDVHLLSFFLFLKSIDMLLTIIQYIHNIFILVNFFVFVFLFFVFFSRLSILMRVRVCCLASAWLAALGCHFNEAEMSMVDSWSLFQVPLVPLISSECIQKWPFLTSDVASLFGQGRETGHLFSFLPPVE